MFEKLKEERRAALATRGPMDVATFAKEIAVWSLYIVLFNAMIITAYTQWLSYITLTSIGVVATTASFAAWGWNMDRSMERTWPKLYWIICAAGPIILCSRIALWAGGVPFTKVGAQLIIGIPLGFLLRRTPPMSGRGLSKETTQGCLLFPPLSILITLIDAGLSRNPRQLMER